MSAKSAPALISLAALALAGCATIPETPLTDKQAWLQQCEDWDEWDKPGPPYQVEGGTYYVGTCGIASILVTGSEGHVLIDAGTRTGAGIVANNIAKLGFDIADVKTLLISHEHFDHVAGIAELQRLSGARLLASPLASQVMETGMESQGDPQFGVLDPFPAAQVADFVLDGDTVELGDIALTGIATPGHTPGAMSWRWQECTAGTCRKLAYLDSLSPISSPAYRFSDNPGYVAAYRAGLDKLRSLECDIVLTPHPSSSAMPKRLAGEGAWIDTSGCLDYANAVEARLDKRLAEEAAGQ